MHTPDESPESIVDERARADSEFVRALTNEQLGLLRYVTTLLGDPEAARNVVQETNMVLWQKRVTSKSVRTSPLGLGKSPIGKQWHTFEIVNATHMYSAKSSSSNSRLGRTLPLTNWLSGWLYETV